MLRKLRKPSHARNSQTKKWFAYFLFGGICLVFVFFTPIGSQLSGYGGGVVAYVGKEALRSREYGLIEAALRREYSSQLNEGTEAEVNRVQEQLRKRALRELIQLNLQAQGAKRQGSFVSDQEVVEEIRGIQVFQEKGRFIYSLYNEFLKNQKWNPRYFEDRIRRQIMARNWNIMFFQAIRSNKLEKAVLKKQQQFQVNLRFVEMELGEEFSDQLEDFVRKKDFYQISLYLKKSKRKWQTTGSFSPTQSSIPKLGDREQILSKIREHLPYKGLIPEVIKTEGRQYVVEILSFNQKKGMDESENFNFILDFNKPKYLFESWMDYQKDLLKVRINYEFFNFSDLNL